VIGPDVYSGEFLHWTSWKICGASNWRRCGPSATNSPSPKDVDAVTDTREQEDRIGLIEASGRAVAGRTRVSRIAEELAADEAVNAADTELFTVSSQLEAAWCGRQLTAVKAITTEVDAIAPQPHDEALKLCSSWGDLATDVAGYWITVLRRQRGCSNEATWLHAEPPGGNSP
jgi:hypothetical protein